jgi:long-subunit acyl-CoA synthetase (AMP-forming)
MSGAAPLDEDLGHAVAQRLGCQLVQGYGMSELSPVSHVTRSTAARSSSVRWRR